MGKCVGIDVSKQHLDWVRGVDGKVAQVEDWLEEELDFFEDLDCYDA
jgi:hypothetical protein